MTCSNCGKDVPFAGKVCPYCKADKSRDQAVQLSGLAGAVLGGAVAVLADASLGWILGGVAIGAFAGVLFGARVPLSK